MLAAGQILSVRQALGKTQAQFGDLLGVSTKAVQSYEQGWRHPSPQTVRILMLLLATHRMSQTRCAVNCWDVRDCPADVRSRCPAYTLQRGQMCWLFTGNLCEGRAAASAESKNETCLGCAVFRALSRPAASARSARPAAPGKRGAGAMGMRRPARAPSR